MKIRISKAEYDALSDALKLIYVVDGDAYKLPLSEGEDPGALRRALDREKLETKAAKETLATAQAELDALKIEPARKTGDIAVLEKSWGDKLIKRENELNQQIATLKKSLESTLIDHATATVVGAITAKPENASLMHPHIKERFEVVYDGDLPTVKIKDATGRISAMNFDELQKELIATPKFSSVVVGSKASGGGAGGQGGGASSGGAGKKLKDMSESDRVVLFRADPAAYRARQAAEGAQ